MQRWKLTGCVGLLCWLIVSPSRSDDGATSQSIPKLITQLSDADPLIRMDAAQRLNNLGESARIELRLALPHATPQTRPEMDRILLHVPWVKPGDSDAVDQAFTGYPELDAQSRCTRVREWISQLQVAGQPALLRIVLNDPSAAVRWVAADALRLGLDDNPAMGAELLDIVQNKHVPPQMYLPPDENAPLLAAAGCACHQSDPHRTDDLLQRAMTIETEQPSAFLGQMDFVYLWLIDRAELQRDRGRMIELLRKQANCTAWDDEHVPDAVSNLIADQAEYGPLPGFADDLRLYRDYFTHPEMVYAMARLCERQGHPQLAKAMQSAAILMSGSSADDHLLVGSFLELHDWDEAAERELRWSLNLSNGKSPYVYFQLSQLADKRNDDLAAAHYMEAGLQHSTELIRTTRYGKLLPWTADQAWAEVHWHYLRAARQSKDLVCVKTHLEKLLTMDQDQQIFHKNPGMASDVVPALQDQGRTELADKIFDAAYIDLRDLMKAAPEDAMAKNNLAWLCACSGKKLEEAARLAGQAVSESPDDAACLDTQAEVYMRMNNPGKALEIETHALQIKPDDTYMQKQLQKFQAAAARPAH